MTQAIFPRNQNVPGDGKFDQSEIPGVVDLQIGRVDMANLPAFDLSETELLRQYLDRDHAFRHKLMTAPARGIVLDSFTDLTQFGEAYAANGFGYMSSLLGSARVQAPATQAPRTRLAHGTWFRYFGRRPALFGYVCGYGSGSGVDYFASTEDFAALPSQAVFTALFGSHFGDWDTEAQNLLRAPLANTGFALASVWAGRPYWYFHPLGQGHTLGYCAQLTQNNQGLYPTTLFAHGIQTALMGDPTLRLHQIAPPSAVALAGGAADGTAQIAWRPSPDKVAGYQVFRSNGPDGPFTRVSQELVPGTVFNDPAPPVGAVYQVRAVRLEVSNSGSYWNSSQGIFPDPLVPAVSLSVAEPFASATGQVAGRIVFTRTGPARGDLFVVYTLAGDAVAGFDYTPLSGSITIPDGSSSATLFVRPVTPPAGFGHRLRLALAPSGAYHPGVTTAEIAIAGRANPYAPTQGTYRAAIDPGSLPASSIRVTLGSGGAFSGALWVGSTRAAFRGRLNSSGVSDFDTTAGVHLHLAVDWYSDPIALTGELTLTADGSAIGNFAASRAYASPTPSLRRGR